MVFYFSGTGNSLWVADQLAKMLGEPLVSVAGELRKTDDSLVYALRETEPILFVYPVHSWGPAVPVLRFISRLKFTGYTGQPIYSVCTCGDECGYTDRRIRKALAARGLSLTAAYSVRMPNNYILLPGFSVDSPEVEKKKLEEAPARVAAILDRLKKESKECGLQPDAQQPEVAAMQSDLSGGKEVSFYHTGSFPFVKSYLIYPLFTNFAIGKNAFYATDACISCGLCARLCPTGTITLSASGRPQWADTCVQCVACIHRCPVRAIEYGKETQKKGRYCHPQISPLNKTDK